MLRQKGRAFRLKWFLDGGAQNRRKQVAFLPDGCGAPRQWDFASGSSCNFPQICLWEGSSSPNFVGPQKASGAPLS